MVFAIDRLDVDKYVCIYIYTIKIYILNVCVFYVIYDISGKFRGFLLKVGVSCSKRRGPKGFGHSYC